MTPVINKRHSLPANRLNLMAVYCIDLAVCLFDRTSLWQAIIGLDLRVLLVRFQARGLLAC